MTAAATAPRLGGRLRPDQVLPLLLVFVPLAILGEWLHWSRVAVFVLAGLAIIPLAGLMGGATEGLASRFGAGVAGLLNATFGNAAELIISIVALRAGLFDVVKASLTGSIIGNVLLVLGLAIVAGRAGRGRARGAGAVPLLRRARGRARRPEPGGRGGDRERALARDRGGAVRRLPAEPA